jgi:hypothetical protein
MNLNEPAIIRLNIINAAQTNYSNQRIALHRQFYIASIKGTSLGDRQFALMVPSPKATTAILWYQILSDQN